MNKIYAFDGLRVFASLFIILHHYRCHFPISYFTSAALAVEIFFVLSGFLLAKTYEKIKDTSLTPLQQCQTYFLVE